jgi:hypothetical protein
MTTRPAGIYINPARDRLFVVSASGREVAELEGPGRDAFARDAFKLRGPSGNWERVVTAMSMDSSLHSVAIIWNFRENSKAILTPPTMGEYQTPS